MNRDYQGSAVAIGLAVALGIAAFVPWYVPRPVTSDEYAAWAQGVGTVIAVVVAAWVGLIPSRLEAARHRDERTDFCTAVISAAKIAEGSCMLCASAIGRLDRGLLRSGISIMRGLNPTAALDKLLEEPMRSWPSTALYVNVVNLRAVVASLEDLRVTSKPANTPAAEDQFWGEASRRMSSVSSHIRNVIQIAESTYPHRRVREF